MFDLLQNRNNFILCGFVVIGLVALYFLHDFYTRRLIHNELKKIVKAKKRKNTKLIQNKNKNKNTNEDEYNNDDDEEQTQNEELLHNEMKYKQEQRKNVKREMDSYIDPSDDNMENINDSQSSGKLNKSNVMMRDMMDGF